MATTTFNFAGGADFSPSWESRWLFQFSDNGGGWVFNDQWALAASYQTGPLTIGAGWVTTLGVPTYPFTYKERIFLANGQYFNFSDNDNITEFEQQGPGAGFVGYLSQLGQQDSVVTFAQLQSRLAVIASRSIQMWQVDADPSQFALVQQLDNVGTSSPDSTRNQGDYDNLFLDATGVRALKTLEVTLNNVISDTGTPIDNLVKPLLANYDLTKIQTVVDPATRNYWIYINGTIFVHARYSGSELDVNAWSTYLPKDNSGATFVPTKFVVYNGQVYARATIGGSDYLLKYGGNDNTTYDTNQVSGQLPWLDAGLPGMNKQLTAIEFIVDGKWNFKVSTTPQNDPPADDVGSYGSTTTPNSLNDSSFDIGRIPYDNEGTHFSVAFTSQNTSTSKPAKLGMIAIHFNKGNQL